MESGPSETFDHRGVSRAELAAKTDRELLELAVIYLDHLDALAHPVAQLAMKAAPLLERWGGFLGSPVRDYRKARRAARDGGRGPAGTPGD